ncbi:MAG TPA: glucose-1-phosphate thymidylyltransferase RfbA [Leptospiraceae bacterium]|nr:glucose-1-phosphate thymidylyltransferase RfbA [Leptospiraceae bacterium]HNF15098.1 glucose-1-phosphate thymidylyltransferase RfbA [Leptospiraceae bacterium]HNF23459.1 glucose-1-phosphate thymidylyltransferase RfbA [Leptospiraceae bacterium]HNH07283.1 glucose-1-phosphate thymidylyltransferase RfbA [Leptospiraceae bacterium]HNI25892.1 glucose-1-phosphate thymidylyltransferase RfbA [Leptospiraceae bacterium]
MKGIILAGGSGTRLYPVTRVVSKQLMPVYDKPMIYYPLSVLMLTGIREILIISTPGDSPLFEKLFGDGSSLGIRIEYAVQPAPEGLAQAFLIGKKFLNGEPSCLILGDNIFYGHGMIESLSDSALLQNGGIIYGYYVNDPERYGVVEFDSKGNVLSLEEKPERPKSNYAVPGIYFYDGKASEYAEQLKPSKRGELEITDLNRMYLEKKSLKVNLLGRGVAWLDTGTHESLSQAGQFIEIIEKRQGLKVGCIEEIAYRKKYITKEQLLVHAESMIKNEYGQYLKRIADEI